MPRSSLKFTFTPKSELDDMVYQGGVSDELVDGERTNVKLHHHPRPTISHRPSSPHMPPSLSNHSWLPIASNANNATFTGPHSPSPRMKNNDRSFDNADSNRRNDNNVDNQDNLASGSNRFDPFPSATTHDSPSPSASLHSYFHQYSSSLPSRHRTSFLSAASDALGLRKKIGSVSRKKPNFHSVPHTSNIIPGVIEINAHNNTITTSMVGGATAHKDYEDEERERLRDVAAQSIGLDPELLHRSCKSASRTSLDSPQSLPQPARIPSFPATLASLHPFTELSATLPKFVPPSSLLVYALAKQWKPRTFVLTSHPVSHKTHVHLFKSASKDEKEVERLEVTEDSAIFVAEKEVGGRSHVVKFAGKDVSSKRGGASIGEESLRAMWSLQITDPVESQRWITAIKNAVLTQRAVRAGLDIPARMDGRNEPKGDMDVVLSMRLQGIISTPSEPSSAVSPSPPPILTLPSPPPSVRSLRINIPPSPSSATAMKGIFSGTRPHSPSVEGSPTNPYLPGHAEDSFGVAGTSLLTMLRTKSSLDSSSSPSQSHPLPLPHASGQGSPAPSLRSNNAPVVITASDLKISKERDAPELSTAVTEACSSGTPTSSKAPLTPLSCQGTLTLSLQPPPRKSKHAVAATPDTFSHEPRGMYKQASGNRSVAGNFGIPSRDSGNLTPRGTSLVSLESSDSSCGQPESLSPNSGFETSPNVGEGHVVGQSDEVTRTLLGNGIVNSSGGGFLSTDKLVQNTATTKRWSRQGVLLPKQPIPPSGPPPSVPSSLKKNYRTSAGSSISIPVTYTADRSTSSLSSNSHSQSRIIPRSGSSLSPTLWKRASSSSTYSASSTSTSDSQGRSQRPVPVHGVSFPLSLGSVASNSASSRPMSMSVLGSSPVAHIGTTKRRSMPPPRPAPNFAPPPAPVVQESAPLRIPAVQQRSFRSSVAQRAQRFSLISPKPPPSSALPPRPDEATFIQGHRRSSSSGTLDVHPIPVSSLHPAGNSSPIQPSSPAPRNLTLRQRLRILSSPSASYSPVPSPSSMSSVQVSTLDLGDDNDDDLSTPCFQPAQSFGLGEHIITLQNDPSFLLLETPATPTILNPSPLGPCRPISPSLSTMNGLGIPLLRPDCDFVALSPPPRRRSSKSHMAITTQPEKPEGERSGSGEQVNAPVALSQRGSVVSLGDVAT